MPAGYSSRCKACNSPIRTQIESWKVVDGLTTNQISLKLKEMGEPISRPALDNHFAEHYDIQAEVREQYNQSQVNLQQEASERVSEIQVLDEIVAGKHRLHKTLENILSKRLEGLEESADIYDLPKLPQSYVQLYNGTAAEVRQCLKTKQELLGEDSGAKKAQAMETWIDLMMEEDDK